MNNIQTLIRAVLAQHQHWLFRAGTKASLEAAEHVDTLGADVSKSIYEIIPELSDSERQSLLRGKYTTPALKEFRSSLNAALSYLRSGVDSVVSKSSLELAEYESSYAYRLLNAVAKDIKNPNLDAEAVYNNAIEKPAVGKLYSDWLDEIEDSARRRIFQNVRNGVAGGQSTDNIVRGIKGTRAAKYKDGILNVTRREVETLVRTTRTHISNEAYEQTYAAIGVEYLIVCATLDGRTSFYCATHDGVRYKVGTDYPSPPYHPNCRTVLMPDIDGSGFEIRPANTSTKSIGKLSDEEKEKVEYTEEDGLDYSQWFAKQSAGFQKKWLGPTRYDLYKNGDYSIDRFTDKQGRAYTIDELRESDEQTFKELDL